MCWNMDSDSRELLYLLGEIFIATVALTGIIMVLLGTKSERRESHGAQIAMQLRMSSTVTIFAVFPLVMEKLGLSGEMLWRVSSGAYLSTLLYFNARAIFSVDPTLRPKDQTAFVLIALTGAIAMVTLTSNLFVGGASLHIAQLFIAWVASILLFRMFIIETLVKGPADA